MRKQKGFSLIELLIVVAIILIIAAIAIPNLMRARMSANESSAVGSVRSINTAEITYNATYPDRRLYCHAGSSGRRAGAACTPASTTACFIDSVLSRGTKSGYTFTAASAAAVLRPYRTTASAAPLTVNQTGIRNFCSFEDAVVRVQSTGAAMPRRTCPRR